MDVRLKTTLLVAIGIVTASCSGATATDTPIDEALETPSTSVASPTSPAEAVDVGIRMRRDVRSSDASSESPQMATLRTPPGLDGSGPVVVLLHGAGGPTRQSLEAMAEAVADLGIPVLNASWAASPAHPREAAADAVCAVAYAFQQAASWGANRDRVIVMGHSGGGHVGMLAALAPEVFPECPTAADAHVWGYIGLAGDPTTAAPGGNLYPFWKDYPEVLAVMDATNHIGGNPDLIARFVHGTEDGTVKIERTIAFTQTLINAGYNSLHIPVEGGSHGDPANPTTDAGIAVLRALQELIDQSP
jgi:acetyl esterase/lipase